MQRNTALEDKRAFAYAVVGTIKPCPPCFSMYPKPACAKKPDQANDDQVNRDNKIQEARHEQNKNAGDKRHQWCQAQVNIHDCVLCIDMQTGSINRAIAILTSRDNIAFASISALKK